MLRLEPQYLGRRYWRSDSFARGFQASTWLAFLRGYGVVVLFYLLMTWFTEAPLMGDTAVYVASIQRYEHGGPANLVNPFWDFGHLLWRPLGWLFFRLSRPLTALMVGTSEQSQIAEALMILSWTAGFAAVLLMRNMLGRLGSGKLATIVTVAFVASYGFINYAQTGSSYVPGLALLLLAVWDMARHGSQADAPPRITLIAVIALAGSVCLWLPYVLTVPAALLVPIFIHGQRRFHQHLILRTCVAAAVCIALAYSVVMAVLGIHNMVGLKEWIASSSHGYHQTGVLRSLFGFARSFINMGGDGLLFKRYLLRDPYNPVSLWDLFRLSLWKFGFFYAFLIWMIVRLLHTKRGKLIFALLVIAAVPVFIFAVFIFEGGMPERYLALYPFFFLGLLYAVDSVQTKTAFRYLTLLFVLVLIISDFQVMANPVLRHQQDKVMARIADLQPRLDSRSLIATVHLQDELTYFSFTFPFHPMNQQGQLRVYSVLEPGADRILTWREDFARKVLTAWESGGNVWLSKRFFQLRPRPEWNWVEGDDKRISWADFQPFFSQFETGEGVGNEDGFVLLVRSARNEDLLRLATANKN